ncbi:glycoside hydrolase family protein [Rubellicoccus peritrichatus]|uniref:Glycoside hydrolase family protein n=1 Tax=Rubellicoccus peritrichatus TaxID=3080537 RepID=A0AAQ3LDG5_9BACT|nr:glycoside hydrolase family protein [Puniceicoccus sp. CR14]WOO43700.1 glycoside hydrolase family protein [Puniceicoccus sp. CR14]
MPGWFVWCGSMVRDPEGLYHLFLCRWPEETNHDGWINRSEVIRAEASSLEEPFTFKEVVMTRREGDFWDADNVHNVCVQEYDGRYYMYYTGNCGNGDYWSHRNNQRIGVAVADNVRGPWIRPSQPLLKPRPGQWDGLMHANPVTTRMPDGRYLLMFKGVAEGAEIQGSNVRHGVAFSDTPVGPFEIHPDIVFDLEGVRFPYEDPGLWVENDVIYCLLKTMDGRYSPTGDMGILLFRSVDGINWEPAEPHFVIDRKIQMEDGSQLEFERLERPQIFIDHDQKRYLLAAVQPGTVGLAHSNSHIVGPSGLSDNVPVSYHVRLEWTEKL